GFLAPEDVDPIADPQPTYAPKPLLFGVHQQALWAITVAESGNPERDYTLARSMTGNAGDWNWPLNTAATPARYVKLDDGCVPYQLLTFPTQTGINGLWVSTNQGLAVYDSNDMTWTESLMWNVPPHPDFGRSAAVFRPGEALWVASGGGDLMKLTSNGVIVPASGPGGTGSGLPESRRGSVRSMATDLANLYLLLSKRNTDGTHNMTLIAGTGIGWHPLWENDDVNVSDPYSVVRVAASSMDDLT